MRLHRVIYGLHTGYVRFLANKMGYIGLYTGYIAHYPNHGESNGKKNGA